MKTQYQQLEEEFGTFAHEQNVVACSSGTAALHLALEVLRLPPGSGVVVPDFTMVACARAVTLAGLVLIIADCDSNLGLDWSSVDAAVEKAALAGILPKVIMPIHIYGRCCRMDRLGGLAYKYSLRVVEDCAEIHGANLGPISDARCWSFYKNKIISGEEGGAIAFPTYGQAELARVLRNQGFLPEFRYDYTHLPRGHNYRLAESLAQQVRTKIHYYSRILERRRQIEAWYEAACPPEWRMPAREAPWVYDLRIPGLIRFKQKEIVEALNTAGIEARCGFKPLSQQEEYKRDALVKCSVAVKAANEVFYLPIMGVQEGWASQGKCRQAFEIIHKTLP